MSRDEQRIDATSRAVPPRVLIVTMGGRLFGLDADAVQGLLARDEAEPPDAPMVQGAVYRVVDLAERLGFAAGTSDMNVHLVLLSNGASHGGLRVGKVHGLMELQVSQVLPLPPQFSGVERQWYRGMILFQNSVALILSTPWILDDHRVMPSDAQQKAVVLLKPEYPMINDATC